jgi:hypothetical protein
MGLRMTLHTQCEKEHQEVYDYTLQKHQSHTRFHFRVLIVSSPPPTPICYLRPASISRITIGSTTVDVAIEKGGFKEKGVAE